MDIRKLLGTRSSYFVRSGVFISQDGEVRGLSARIIAESTERLPLTGCRRRLDRVQHAMARDRVVERGAEMRAFAIVAGETRVRLGHIGGWALRRRPAVPLRRGQGLERRLRPPAAAYRHLKDLRLTA